MKSHLQPEVAKIFGLPLKRLEMPTPNCPKCNSNEWVSKALPRDAHSHICCNHQQDLFFTPKLP